MSNIIELKPIVELSGMNFFIPGYQRGYRWTKQQVKDLLDDIQEFIDNNQVGFYCIQPLVVKERKQEVFKRIKEEAKDLDEIKSLLKGSWEVIDGQQRLTTIYILLSYLDRIVRYTIEYETRTNSESFLSSIEDSKSEENIDYFHIVEAKKQIEDWFLTKEPEIRANFFDTLLNKVKFIWYESVDEDPIKVFTRLNIGKISLTNAELIKALFLNKSNFKGNDYQKIRLQQQEIAIEWDQIEYSLQNDEFWLFIHEANDDKPTRIDFIFDLIAKKDTLKLSEQEKINLGTDEYRTFRYFYAWFRSNKKGDITSCWREIKNLFATCQEWFNDLELYHYVGFLVEHKTKVSDIIDEWNKPGTTKESFISGYIYSEIKKKLSLCADLEKQYEISGNPKTQCRPILLLHNIQTVINQNKNIEESEKYKLPVFYKFPFHLFKREKWDVEHIDSHTENPLENEKEQKEWLKYSYDFINNEVKLETGENLKQEIEKFISPNSKSKKFDLLRRSIIDVATSRSNNLEGENTSEKDKLWNFTLLDFSTNRSYGNAIFPAKRRCIIGKDQGKTITVNDEFEIEEKNGAIAFIPPCTRNIFIKYYSPLTNNLREWDKDDAKAYKKNIETVLSDFLKTVN